MSNIEYYDIQYAAERTISRNLNQIIYTTFYSIKIPQKMTLLKIFFKYLVNFRVDIFFLICTFEFSRRCREARAHAK